MINKTIIEELYKYKENNPDMSVSDMSNAKHLIMNQILNRKYFEGINIDMYINDLENITFYNGVTSVSNIPKEEFSNTGGYILTGNQADRLEEIQDILSEAKCLNDLVGKFEESDAVLIQKFLVALPKDEFFALICMAKFKENINNDPDYQISYQDYYAGSMLLVGVEQGCSLDQDLKYSFDSNDIIKRHLTNNVGVITQERLSACLLKGIIRAENKTLAAICDKKLVTNPDIEDSNNKTIHSDLSAIYNNALIKENTIFGILFDDQLSGPDKLTKIYDKKYFQSVKGKFINMIDFQLNKPTIEDLNERYSKIIEPIIEKIDNTFPMLTSVRTDNIYYEKSNFNFDKFFTTTRNKDSIISRDLFTAEKTLINATMDGYFSRTFDQINLKFVERLTSDSFKMTTTHIENYHNNIESLLLMKTRLFSERDVPRLEKPNLIVLDQLSFPSVLIDKSFEILHDYVKEQQKSGVTIIININNFNLFNKDIKEKLLDLDVYPNIIISAVESFEVKLNTILETLDQYDKRTVVLSSSEKNHLIVTALDRMNIEFTDSVSSYSSNSANRVTEFMTKVIKEEFDNGFKYKKEAIQKKKDAIISNK